MVAVHDAVINPGELQGLAGDKSLEGALARVEFRLAYGLIDDVFDLAAAHAAAIATGHVFNDANKRTAFQVMDLCLAAHGVTRDWVPDVVGPVIIDLAQGKIDEVALAAWLRRG